MKVSSVVNQPDVSHRDMFRRTTIVGYVSKKLGSWTPKDVADGEYSGKQLRARIASNQKEASDYAESTWPRPNTLSKAQIEALDSASGERNGIGCPVKVESPESPRGFKEGTVSYGQMNR